MSDTLNYWLGKLSRLQLFGHGTKPLCVRTKDGHEGFRVVDVFEEYGIVTIVIE